MSNIPSLIERLERHCKQHLEGRPLDRQLHDEDQLSCLFCAAAAALTEAAVEAAARTPHLSKQLANGLANKLEEPMVTSRELARQLGLRFWLADNGDWYSEQHGFSGRAGPYGIKLWIKVREWVSDQNTRAAPTEASVEAAATWAKRARGQAQLAGEYESIIQKARRIIDRFPARLETENGEESLVSWGRRVEDWYVGLRAALGAARTAEREP